MKHVRMLGLCLVAIFAMSAVASASAWAEGRPEFKNCAKASKVGKEYAGHYSDKGCTVAAEHGKYEREEVKEGTPYASKTKAVTINVKGKAVKCKKGADSGVIHNQFGGEETFTLSDCAVNGNKAESCGASGTVKTDPLTTALYFVNKAETQPGIAIYGTEGVFAEFKCGTENIVIEGILLGAVTNTTKGQTDTFAISGGKQALQDAYFSGEGIEAHLTSGESEVTVEGVDETGPKGVGVFA